MADNTTLEDTASAALKNHDLSITFHSGETIGPFLVTWNYGMRDFMASYEAFLKGGTQTQFRFQMEPDPKGPETTLLVDFKNVAAISAVIRTQ